MVVHLLRRLLQPIIKMPYYAVRAGRTPGIYTTWDECKKQVDKFHAPKFKKFSTEAEAASFIKGEAATANQKSATEESTSKTKRSGLQKQIASTEVELLNERLNHQENEERLLLKEQRLELMKDQLESTESNAGKVKKTKGASKHQKTPYSRPTASSSNWSQNKTTQLISPDEVRQIHTSTQSNAEGSSGSVPVDGAVVYTDGACHNNGQNNPCAGIGVYWGPDHPLNVSERLSGRQTNNRAEIHAVVCAAKQARQKGLKELTVKTDSQFLINSMTKWLKGWQKKGWITAAGKEVINREDFEDLIEASEGLNINWVHVKGHDGVEGNECADKLAVLGTKKKAAQ